MTELDIMKHARGYMDKLSRGIDPISGGPLPGDTTLNNIRLQKCFAYVSEQGAGGKPQRLPTDKGVRLGLSVRKGQGRDGEYLAVYYSEQAQRYILDHLEQILDK